MWPDETRTFWNKGASPKKFYFTYEDISEMTRLTVPTIRAYVHQKKFDPKSLISVVRFVAPYLGYEEKGNQTI